jgi:hypothetical protein
LFEAVPRLRDRTHRPALILLFAKKFFRGPSRTGTYQRFGFAAQTRTQIPLTGSSATLANEVERSNILAPGVNPSSRLHRRLMATIGLGKSYPVTAAQLLPVFTGFLAPIHFSFSSSQRTGSTTTRLRFPAQDKFHEPRYNGRRGHIVS